MRLHTEFAKQFKSRSWQGPPTAYWVTEDARLIRKTLQMSAAAQKVEIEAAGLRPIRSYNQTDFVKDRAAVEVQFGKYFAVAYDLFVKHLAFFLRARHRITLACVEGMLQAGHYGKH